MQAVAESANPRFSEDLVSKNDVETDRGRYSELISSLHMHVDTCACMYMDAPAHKSHIKHDGMARDETALSRLSFRCSHEQAHTQQKEKEKREIGAPVCTQEHCRVTQSQGWRAIRV